MVKFIYYIMNIINKYMVDFSKETHEEQLILQFEKYNKYSNKYYFLNKNEKEMTYMEKFIYESAEYHCNQRNIDINDEDLYIEYWLKNDAVNSIHIDKDEGYWKKDKKMLTPMFTIMFSFHDSNVPTVITNQTKNKPIKNLVTTFIFPEKNSQLVFSGGKYYHGLLVLNEDDKEMKRNVILLSIYKYSSSILSDKDTTIFSWNNGVKKKYDDFRKQFLNESLSKDDIMFKKHKVDMNTELIKSCIGNFQELFLYKKEMISKMKEEFMNMENINRNTKYRMVNFKDIYNYNESDFILYGVATEETDEGYKIFSESIKEYGINYRILGLNEKKKYDMSSFGGAFKIAFLKKELSNYSDDELVKKLILFTDTYDVFFTGGKKDIIDRYIIAQIEYNCPHGIIFSSEKVCWPDEGLKFNYEETYTPYKYLNSGSFIGNGLEIKELLKDFNELWHDDQNYYAVKFTENLEFQEMCLDYKCILFQTLQSSFFDVKQIGNKYENSFFKTNPVMIHGNGGIKEKLIWKSMYKMLKNGMFYKDKPLIDYYLKRNFQKEITIDTFVISLEKEKVRLQKMKEEVKQAGLSNVKFLKAVDGRTDLDKYKFKISPYYDMRKGEVGTFLSHYSLWYHIVKNEIKLALIIEDDARLNYNYNYEVNKIIEEIPTTDYDLFNLHPYYQEQVTSKDLIYYKEGIFEGGFAYNLTSYLLTYNGALKLIKPNCLENMICNDDYTNVMGNTSPIKEYNELFKNEEKIKILNYWQGLCNQSEEDPSIADNTDYYDK